MRRDRRKDRQTDRHDEANSRLRNTCIVYVSREIFLLFICSPCPSKLHTTSNIPKQHCPPLALWRVSPITISVLVLCPANRNAVKRWTCNHSPTVIRTSGVPRGVGGLGCSLPEIPKALQNGAKLNPIVKTVKNC